MKTDVRARLVYAISDHVHVASEAGAALDAVLAVVEEALEEARDQALPEALRSADQQLEGIDVERDGDVWQVFDDLMQDGDDVPDTWTDDHLREIAGQRRREAAWYDAVIAARHAAL